MIGKKNLIFQSCNVTLLHTALYTWEDIIKRKPTSNCQSNYVLLTVVLFQNIQLWSISKKKNLGGYPFKISNENFYIDNENCFEPILSNKNKSIDKQIHISIIKVVFKCKRWQYIQISRNGDFFTTVQRTITMFINSISKLYLQNDDE